MVNKWKKKYNIVYYIIVCLWGPVTGFFCILTRVRGNGII